MIDSWIGRSEFLGDELYLRFALALLHFLWQGAAIGIVVASAVWILRNSSPSSRYTLHSVALVCLPVCLAVTFATVDVPSHWRMLDGANKLDPLSMGSVSVASTRLTPLDETRLGQPAPINEAIEAAIAEGAADGLHDKRRMPRPLFVRVASAVTAVYSVGACLFLLRLMAATWGGHRLRIASNPIDDPTLLKLVIDQSRRVGLRLVPTVAYCERVAVPMAVGVLRPVVLLPVSIMTGLDPEQFAAIISHELAHIRRYDLLMNLIQRLIESLLFFHPVVWYISRRMSGERESCCDDLVVSSGYNPMDYAGALLQMAELCSPARQAGVVAVAASGRNVSQLEVRIQRLFNRSRESQLRLTWAGVLMIALLICFVAATPALLRNQAHAQSVATGAEAEGDERGRDETLIPETVESKEKNAPVEPAGNDGKPAAETPAENADEEVARLQKIWQGWSNTVTSMEVEGYTFLADFGETGLSRDAVHELIFETILPNVEPGVTTLDELKSLTNSQFSDRPVKDSARPLGAWRPFTLVEDTDAVRVDEEIDGRKHVTVRKDGREQRYLEGSKQASLFTTHTGLQIERIETFLPNHKLSKPKDLQWMLQSTASDETQHLELMNADGRGIVFEYDGQTGFVRDHAILLSKGVYYRERLQSHPIVTTIGVPIPQIAIDLHFSQTPDGGSVTRWMEIHVINQVQLNQPVTQERFQISVPAGTRIVRFEGGDNQVPPSQGGTRPQITTVDRPVADVLAVPATPPKARAASGTSRDQ